MRNKRGAFRSFSLKFLDIELVRPNLREHREHSIN